MDLQDLIEEFDFTDVDNFLMVESTTMSSISVSQGTSDSTDGNDTGSVALLPQILGNDVLSTLPKEISRYYHRFPARNFNFSGRKSEFQVFCDLIKSVSGAITVAITGPPGIGKTEFAKVVGHNLHDFFGGNLIWINADSPDSLKSSFHSLARELGIATLRDQVERNLQDITGDICRYFQPAASLFVLDNANGGFELEQFLENFPPNNASVTTKPYVLLTCLYKGWLRSDIICFPLGVLSPSDSYEFLESAFWTFDIAEKERKIGILGQTLGYYTLGMRQAARYIQLSHRHFQDSRKLQKLCPIEDFLAIFSRQSDTATHNWLVYDGRPPGDTSYSNSVYVTWTLVLQKIRLGLNAHQVQAFNWILGVISFCSPVLCPMFLLYDQSPFDRQIVAACLDFLEDYFILERVGGEEPTFSMHRLVQQVIRAQLEDSVSTLLVVCDHVLPYITLPFANILQKEKIRELEFVLHSARTITENLLKMSKETIEQCNDFLHAVWYAYFLLFRKEDALDFAKKVCASVIAKECKDEVKYVWKNYLGASFTSLHWKTEAEDIFVRERLVEVASTSLGENHPVTLKARIGLANFYMEVGQLLLAGVEYGATANICADVLRKKNKSKLGDPDITAIGFSRYYATLGIALLCTIQKKFDATSPYSEGISTASETFGKWSIQAVIAMYFEANHLGLAGKYEAASKSVKKVAKPLLNGFGYDHVLTISALGKQCEFLIAQRKYRKAEKLLQKLFENGKKALNQNDTFYFRLQGLQALLLRKKAAEDSTSLKQAEEIYENILAKQQVNLGYNPNHPNVLETETKLATTLFEQNSLGQSLEKFSLLKVKLGTVMGRSHAEVVKTEEMIQKILQKMEGLDICDELAPELEAADDDQDETGSDDSDNDFELEPEEHEASGSGQFRCGEPNCGKSYKNESTLVRHLAQFHSKGNARKSYECKKCQNNIMYDRTKFIRHLKAAKHVKLYGDSMDLINELEPSRRQSL